ncbi:hypothetical protein KIPB_009824, partial [Kipferlia bialata]
LILVINHPGDSETASMIALLARQRQREREREALKAKGLLSKRDKSHLLDPIPPRCVIFTRTQAEGKQAFKHIPLVCLSHPPSPVSIHHLDRPCPDTALGVCAVIKSCIKGGDDHPSGPCNVLVCVPEESAARLGEVVAAEHPSVTVTTSLTNMIQTHRDMERERQRERERGGRHSRHRPRRVSVMICSDIDRVDTVPMEIVIDTGYASTGRAVSLPEAERRGEMCVDTDTEGGTGGGTSLIGRRVYRLYTKSQLSSFDPSPSIPQERGVSLTAVVRLLHLGAKPPQLPSLFPYAARSTLETATESLVGLGMLDKAHHATPLASLCASLPLPARLALACLLAKVCI